MGALDGYFTFLRMITLRFSMILVRLRQQCSVRYCRRHATASLFSMRYKATIRGCRRRKEEIAAAATAHTVIISRISWAHQRAHHEAPTIWLTLRRGYGDAFQPATGAEMRKVLPLIA